MRCLGRRLRGAHAQGFLQGNVAGRERIGPAQRPHGNVLRRPVPDAGQGLQGGAGGAHIDTGMQRQLPVQHGTGQGLQGALALAHDAQATQLVGFGRRRATLKDVILLVDTSGSMATSVVYSGIIAAVLASLPSINTRLVMFDTAIVDLTDRLDDPVEMLFGLRLGGGTNIDQALSYARGAITRPRDTIVVLISDLFEGGNKERMVRQVQHMLADGVQFITLLALNDQGAARYNAAVAQELADLGAPAFACTPEQFADLMARALNEQWR